uniref:KIB1-4 beta-propeller domain-containing protein n=1 Tax=Arundo donax TaxID=35708 RepID=A0A0A8ZF38_ARUDO
MSFYQGRLYLLAKDENLLTVNISQDRSTGDPQISQIGQIIKGDPFHTSINTLVKKKLYLVESCGALLMVRRKVWCRVEGDTFVAVAGQNEFEVFKADLEHSQWVNVTTLGDDQMLFLGRRCSRAVSASQHGMTGDHIFFLDDVGENTKEYGFEEESTSVSVYDMRTGEVSCPLPMVWKHELILATWLFPWD